MARRRSTRDGHNGARHTVDPQAEAAVLLTSAEIRNELISGFRTQLALYPDHLLETVGLDRAREYGQRAARAAIAPAVWSVVAEDRWDTSEAVAHLGVTRQALAKRVANGTMIGLPGRGTTHYPVWQFDLNTDPPRMRPAVAAALTAWSEVADGIDPFAVVAWARTSQPELGGASPIVLLQKDENVVPDLADRLVFSARVTASRLSQ